MTFDTQHIEDKVIAQQVNEYLQSLVKPIVSARVLSVDKGHVTTVVEIETQATVRSDVIHKDISDKIKFLQGVMSVHIILTAHNNSSPSNDTQPKQPSSLPSQHSAPKKVTGVKKIIAIASGKGGVGKSTVTTSLAYQMQALGKRVGILDADIYGPSQPHILSIKENPEIVPKENRTDERFMIPPVCNGIQIMSIGLMLKEGQSVVWRGPMLGAALQQMLWQVLWDDLDVLLIDLPPGTGDVSLTLFQRCVVDGLVIVSTPHNLSLIDVEKCINMARKLDINIIGIINNMSIFVCEHCQHQTHVFGNPSQIEKFMQTMNIALLGEVPLINHTHNLDADTATSHTFPYNQIANLYFHNITSKILQSLFEV